jgi:hypothetical protein
MSELPPDVATLIRAGRTAFRPQASDRDRVLLSLTDVLGEGALLDGAHHPEIAKSAASARFLMRGWVLGGLGALAVGAAVVVAARVWTTTPSQAARAAAPSVPTAEPAPSTPVPPSSNEGDRAPDPLRADGPSSSPRSGARSSVAHPPSDSLPEEVRLLSRAEQQLYSGHADEALRTLGEHERRFPGGALAEERMAARIQSLCALGRVAEARADLAKLARAHPRSPHVDRARRFCGIDVGAPP